MGPYNFTYLSAFLYTASTPSMPSHSGLKISPFKAKQWEGLPDTGGITAPKPYAGISLSES